MVTFDFSRKSALVTGASSGMGENIARDLLAAGAKVAILDLQPPAISSQQAFAFEGDLTDPVFVENSVNEFAAKAGGIDYLVNAAGVLWFGKDTSVAEIDLGVWDRVLSINLKSNVHTCRSCIPHMKAAGGGAMVHISTTQCYRGDDKPQDAYQAAKAGVIALSKSIAIQYADAGIRSNTLVPGSTSSPMQQRWVDNPALLDATAAHIPLQRVGSTQDMANAVLFLLSDLASYITGTELIVDGGYLAKP